MVEILISQSQELQLHLGASQVILLEIASGASLVGGGISIGNQAVKTAATHTAAAAEGYFINTTGPMLLHSYIYRDLLQV